MKCALVVLFVSLGILTAMEEALAQGSCPREPDVYESCVDEVARWRCRGLADARSTLNCMISFARQMDAASGLRGEFNPRCLGEGGVGSGPMPAPPPIYSGPRNRRFHCKLFGVEADGEFCIRVSEQVVEICEGESHQTARCRREPCPILSCYRGCEVP